MKKVFALLKSDIRDFKVISVKQKAAISFLKDTATAMFCLFSVTLWSLLTKTKSFNDSTVTLDVLCLEVRKETTTLTYELHEGTVC